MDPQDERELARGLGAGDPDAWRKLYDACAQPLWRVIARLMGPASADVADEARDRKSTRLNSSH